MHSKQGAAVVVSKCLHLCTFEEKRREGEAGFSKHGFIKYMNVFLTVNLILKF